MRVWEGFRSRQTHSAGTASISSDKQEVLAQSLQQDVALLDCDPFTCGAFSSRCSRWSRCLPLQFSNDLKRPIQFRLKDEDKNVTQSKIRVLEAKFEIYFFICKFLIFKSWTFSVDSKTTLRGLDSHIFQQVINFVSFQQHSLT